MSILVIHYCITNHPTLGGLKQPLFFNCSQVCGSTGKFFSEVVHGLGGGDRWTGLSGMAICLSVGAMDVTEHHVAH